MNDLQKDLDKNIIKVVEYLEKEEVIGIMLKYMTFDDKVHYLVTESM